MNEMDTIKARHSVRAYQQRPIEAAAVEQLEAKIAECNRLGGLHIQLILNEPRAFGSRIATYGKFSGVSNYIMMIGPKSHDIDELVGYHGEQLVLLAQRLGLNTCWVGLTYKKVKDAFSVGKGECVACCIAIGYGETQGVAHKTKKVEQVSNADGDSPEWFRRGVEAALLAPTAINQQKFSFEYVAPQGTEKPRVKAHRGFSLVGYTHMDLGIAKLHFEIGAGRDNFEWA